MADPDLNIKDVIAALDGVCCHNVVAGLWADAVANRLPGIAIYLMSDELPEVADHARAAARRLPIGSATSAVPSQVIRDRSSTAPPVAPSSRSLTCSDPRAIISYALQRLNVIIAAYQDFLDQVRGRDDVSFALVVGLLAAKAHRRAHIEAALAGQPGAA